MSEDDGDKYRETVGRFFDAKADEYTDNSRAKDRAVIAVATAALGFSLALFSDPARAIEPDALLAIGWAAFVVSIISVLVTYDLLAWSMRKTLDAVRAWLKDGEGLEPESDELRLNLFGWRPTLLSLLNSLSVYSLIVGIIATTYFMWRYI